MKKRIVVFLASLMCISLCACGGTESTGGNNANTQAESNSGTNTEEKSNSLSNKEQKIEITMDNWQEYFEFIEVVSTNEVYNAFDELVSVSYPYDYCLTIKDKYEIDIDKSNVAIELKGHCEDWSVNVDRDTLEIEYIEKIKDFQTFDNTIEFKQLFKNNKELDREFYYGVQLTPGGEPYTIQFNEETQIGIIHRYFIDEVIRIKGTIYVKETDTKEETVDSSNLTVEEMQTYYDVEKYIGTPRIEKLKVGNYNNDSEYILMSNFEEVGNIKEYEIAVNNRLRVYEKYNCIITDNNTPDNWKDDEVVYIFIE